MIHLQNVPNAHALLQRFVICHHQSES